MLTYRAGAAGTPSAAKSMADYLSIETDVPEPSAELSAYLGSATAPAIEHTTAAIPARDMHPLVADALRIDTTRSLRPDEVTNLLAGRRADGKAIDRPAGNARIAYMRLTDRPLMRNVRSRFEWHIDSKRHYSAENSGRYNFGTGAD